MASSSQASYFLAAALLVSSAAACESTSPHTTKEQLALGSAHAALAAMPKVTHVNLGVANQPKAIAGQLGADLSLVGATFQMQESSLRLRSAERDALGVTVERYAQSRNGLEVIGGDLRLTRDDSGEILSATASGWHSLDAVAVTPSIRESEARQVALQVSYGGEHVGQGRLVYAAQDANR